MLLLLLLLGFANRSGVCAPVYVTDSASFAAALKNDDVKSVAIGSPDPQVCRAHWPPVALPPIPVADSSRPSACST